MTPRLYAEACEHVAGILTCLGEDDLERDGIRNTPERVVKSWEEIYGGYKVKVEDLFTVFEEKADEMVLLKDIEFFSNCEHHMQPFFGKAHIAYIPSGGKVVGVSKLARVLEAYSRRLQIQERIGQQVTAALMQHLSPKGAACVLEAKHFCMTCRGVNKQNSIMVTSSLEGVFKTDPSTRAEFFALIKD